MLNNYYPGLLEAAKAIKSIVDYDGMKDWANTILEIDAIQNEGKRSEMIHSLNRMCEKGKITIVVDHDDHDDVINYSLQDTTKFYKKIASVKQ